MNITILGANGQTGTELTKQALKNGFHVTGLVRVNSSSLVHPHLVYVVGDAVSKEDIVKASRNTDVIVSTVGGSDPHLLTNTVKAVIDACKETGIKRFILMSSFAVKQDYLDAIAKVTTKSMMGIMIDDKTKSEEILRKSSLNWTIIYPTLLSDDSQKDRIHIVNRDEKIGMNNKISRAAVAAFILKEIEDPKYIRSEVIITQQ